MKVFAALCLMIGLASPVSAASTGTDLHDHWDQRCKSCHGHAGDFARRSLRVENGRLAGAHHRTNLSLFLRNHYLSDDLVEPVSRMLAAQVLTPPLFAAHCARCHGNAAEFARASLSLRDGVLISLPSGRAATATLGGHGGLSAADAQTVVDALTRVHREVAGAGR